MKISDMIEINGKWFPISRDETPEEMAERERREAEERAKKEAEFWALPYADRVSALIRERYTANDEFALSRQRSEKPEEWEAYYTFCEDCKERAKTRPEEA